MKLFLAGILALAASTATAAETVLPLWPEGVPGKRVAPSKATTDRIGPKVDEVFAGLPPRSVPIDANMCPAFAGYEFATE